VTTIGSPSVVTDSNACKTKCQNTADCTSWSIRESSVGGDNSCYLRKNNTTTANTQETAHERGIKDPAVYANLKTMTEDGIRSYTNPSDCRTKCDANSSCIGWTHRNNTHTDTTLRNSCILLQDDSSATTKYKDGFINH